MKMTNIIIAIQKYKTGDGVWGRRGGSGGRPSTGASLCLIDTLFMCVCVCVFRGVKCIYTEFFAPQCFCKKVLTSHALLFGKYLNF